MNTKHDNVANRYIEVTRMVASMSPMSRNRMGCIITDKRNNILSMGYNAMKTHPIQSLYASKVGYPLKIYLHAEIAAIVRLRDTTPVPHRLYITRLLSNNSLSMARPCPICLGAIVEQGIKEIVYTNYNSETEKLII